MNVNCPVYTTYNNSNNRPLFAAVNF